jgi:hypothetical protein
MLNWELLSPRNIAVIAVISIAAFAVYNLLHKKIGGQ